jgi:hypothetical protein
MASPSFW